MRALAYLLVCIVLLVPEQAKPCSPAPCGRGGYLLPDGAFPAQLRGLLWTPNQGYGEVEVDRGAVVLQTMNGIEVPMTMERLDGSRATYLIVPNTPLAAGLNYELHVPSTCPDGRPETLEFAVQPAAESPLPVELGALMVKATRRGSLTIASGGGACSMEIDAAQVEVELSLSAEALPWANALVYRTVVDGATWFPKNSSPADVPLGSSWQGRGVDLLYAACDETTGMPPDLALAEGRHEVIFEATLPAGTELFRSQPLMIELSCDPDDNGGGLTTVDAGCSCESAQSGEASLLLGALMLLLLRKKVSG